MAEAQGWFGRLTTGLTKSSGRLADGIGAIFTRRKLDDAALEQLEELLITADLGVETAARLRGAGDAALDAFLAGCVGQTVEALVEKPSEGRSEAFAPIRLSGDHVPGTLVRARAVARGYRADRGQCG